MDTGQGRLANLGDEGWGEWTETIRKQGVITNGLLSNVTVAMAIIDKLLRAFKNSLQASTHKHYVKKIKKNAMQISRRNAEMARKIADVIEVTEAEKAKARSVVGLNSMDLGPILYGELTDKGDPDNSSSIATVFTREKIIEAHCTLGFMPTIGQF